MDLGVFQILPYFSDQQFHFVPLPSKPLNKEPETHALYALPQLRPIEQANPFLHIVSTIFSSPFDDLPSSYPLATTQLEAAV
jgi:hypothetical protein